MRPVDPLPAAIDNRDTAREADECPSIDWLVKTGGSAADSKRNVCSTAVLLNRLPQTGNSIRP
jgi:hypothetical protein